MLFRGERLEGPQRFAASAQQQVADRPSRKTGDACGHALADGNAGPALLGRRFEPRCRIYRVAIGGIAKVAAPAEIPDNCRACIEAETCRAKSNPFFLPALD